MLLSKICWALVPLECRLIAHNLKSICPKFSTLVKCRAPWQLQNSIMFSAIGIYWYCAKLTRRAGVEKIRRIIRHLRPLREDERGLQKKRVPVVDRVSVGGNKVTLFCTDTSCWVFSSKLLSDRNCMQSGTHSARVHKGYRKESPPCVL